MCRMYGHIAGTPLAVSGMLLDAQHSLLQQSCGDWRGEKHRDGWGIGYFDGTKPRVIRRPTSAPDDPEFSAAARHLASTTVIAHVRQASVGDLCVANAHPFLYGPWIFVHNGTVTNFELLRAELVAETDADLRQQVAGTTDSEQVFYWLLSHARRAGQPAETPCRDLVVIMQIMAQGIATLAARSAATQPAEPTRLNFLLTDGTVLVGSRWKHSLYWTNRFGPLASGAGGPGVAVASETIGSEPWAEVPDGYVFAVDADHMMYWLPIQAVA